jgi:hypothetical protein
MRDVEQLATFTVLRDKLDISYRYTHTVFAPVRECARLSWRWRHRAISTKYDEQNKGLAQNEA